jgi:hypothetical protein
MVTGGLAAVIYGHPRLTLDVDLVLRLRQDEVARFTSLWPASEFYVPPLEVVQEERDRPAHGHFNVIHHDSAMRADCYLAGEDEVNGWALARRVLRRIEGEDVSVAPIEAVVLGKLRYYHIGGSDRHLRDVARMLEVSGDAVDRPALESWIDRLGLQEAWDAAQRFEEPD